MFQFSKVISLPVINIFNACVEGVVENICTNTHLKVECLIIYDGDTESYKTLSLSEALSITESAIYIKNSSKITLYENNELVISGCYNPINSNVYVTGKEYIGRITDITFDKRGNVVKVHLNSTDIDPSEILAFNNSVTLLKNNKHQKISYFSPRPAKITQLLNISQEPVVSILHTPAPLPQREITNYSFLINRQILKNIKNYNGEVLAKQNTIITQAVVERLKKYGKLKELILNSK